MGWQAIIERTQTKTECKKIGNKNALGNRSRIAWKEKLQQQQQQQNTDTRLDKNHTIKNVEEK